MKRNLAVKMGERKLKVELERLDAKYKKTKTLLEQALSHRYRFEQAVKAIATRDGTCWCGVRTFGLVNKEGQVRKCILHTVACDILYLVLYGGERGV